MMSHSESLGDLALALCQAQAQIRGAAKDSRNPALHNRYADLASTWDACREPLAAAGLAVIQGTYYDDLGALFLQTLLVHSSGQWISSRLRLAPQGNKGVNEMQALGSAITYARRYLLAAMVGICPADDDGQSSGPPRAEAPRSLPAPPHASGHANGHNDAPAPAPRASGQFSTVREWWTAFLDWARAGWAKAVAAQPSLAVSQGLGLPVEPLILLDRIYVNALDSDLIATGTPALPAESTEPELLAALADPYARRPADLDQLARKIMSEVAAERRQAVAPPALSNSNA